MQELRDSLQEENDVARGLKAAREAPPRTEGVAVRSRKGFAVVAWKMGPGIGSDPGDGIGKVCPAWMVFRLCWER